MDNGRPPGREYLIPSVARRFIAETVDGFILLSIVAAIILSVTQLGGTDFRPSAVLPLIGAEDIAIFVGHFVTEEGGEDFPTTTALALICESIAFLYEVAWIGRAGGATPGKFLLGLRVVRCDTFVLVAPSRALVNPSSDVSVETAAKRALFKRVCFDSVFSLFVTLLFLEQNRTAYDVASGTIVVKRE